MFSLPAVAGSAGKEDGRFQVRLPLFRRSPPPETIVMGALEKNLSCHIFSRRKRSRRSRKKRSVWESTVVLVQMGYDTEVQAVLAPDFFPCLTVSFLSRLKSPSPHGTSRGRTVFFELRSDVRRLKSAEKRRYAGNEA